MTGLAVVDLHAAHFPCDPGTGAFAGAAGAAVPGAATGADVPGAVVPGAAGAEIGAVGVAELRLSNTDPEPESRRESIVSNKQQTPKTMAAYRVIFCNNDAPPVAPMTLLDPVPPNIVLPPVAFGS
jgi:hypothetical protein